MDRNVKDRYIRDYKRLQAELSRHGQSFPSHCRDAHLQLSAASRVPDTEDFLMHSLKSKSRTHGLATRKKESGSF